MSVTVNEALTRQVAQLARLELTDGEVTAFTAQLGKILGYVEVLQELDVVGVEPLFHPFDVLETPLRDDIVRPSPRGADGAPKVLDSAPDVLAGGFKVPPIL